LREPSIEKEWLFRAIRRFKSRPPDYDGSIEGETYAMKSRLLTTAVLLAAAGAASAQNAPNARQDVAAIKRSVEQFLQVQTAGLPGQVTVTVGAIDPRMQLAACPDPQAFFMPGARAWGKTTVGVRCATPTVWTVYIQASVTVMGDYIASAAPLVQGQPIDAGQLVTLKGDLTMLPAGIATDASQVIGRSANVSLPPGTPLRLDTLRSKPVVQSGQLVRLVSSGNGFSVSSEARAMGSAGDGQVVQVKTSGGQQITGIAKTGGLVEVAF
jgi:flagella basal body P-ring formation protein FlgA